MSVRLTVVAREFAASLKEEISANALKTQVKQLINYKTTDNSSLRKM